MAEVAYRKLRALIVDDFDSFRTTVSKMLQDTGITHIDCAVNGLDALRQCKQKSYDLILCDQNLGKGKTGQQVLEDLRHSGQLSQSSLFILISAESSKSIIMAAYDYEPDAYLTKPLTTKTLQQRLDRLFAQRSRMAPVYQAIEDKQLDLAISLCCKEIASAGRSANQCQKLLGQLYIQVGDFAKAETVYREVLEVRQLDWAQVGMARVKKLQGDLLSAQQWLEEVMNTNPLFMKAYDIQAEIYREQNLNDNLQKVLQEAVNISPLSLLRQQQLGDVAWKNNDLLTAATAFRRTVRLGENSCYDRLANHTGFAYATLALLKEDAALARPLLREALKTMAELEQRFVRSPEEKIESWLIESQLFAGNGDIKKSEECLRNARAAILSSGRESINLNIELVRALLATGQKIEAEKLIQELLHRYEDSEADLQKLDILLEEPASEKNRSAVAEINKQGIAFYDAENFDSAIECFNNALRTFPNHIGIRLNLVQALGDKLTIEFDNISIELANRTIEQVASLIVPTHDQFYRYRQLQAMLEDIGKSRRNC